LSPDFPELENFDDEEFARQGYIPRWLSIFEHWLSTEEADACAYLFFEQALKAGLEALYLEQEARFLSFYRDLLTGPISGYSDGTLSFYEGWGDMLAKDIQASLREKCFIDLHCSRRQLRIMGGYDRTDLLLFKNIGQIPLVQDLSTRHGLFLLS